MIQPLKTTAALLFGTLVAILSACHTEDPGPLQETDEEYSIIDFDRLEMGSALNIRVEQANTFSIQVRGDRRNVDDLEVFKSGTTLVARFDNSRERKHDTYITITMPALKEVNFSGASLSKIIGFESDDELKYYLSGGSESQLDAGYKRVSVVLSGASSLRMSGLGDILNAEVSGASELSAYDFPVREANIDASGASNGKVTVTDELRATAGGASSISYRGSPVVDAKTSGASTIRKD